MLDCLRANSENGKLKRKWFKYACYPLVLAGRKKCREASSNEKNEH